MDAVLEEGDAEVLSAIRGCDAELRDVRDIVRDTGAQEHANQSAVAFVAEDPGSFRVEDAAAGEADDVVEEAQGAVQGAILVVDTGVKVSEVGLVDELGGGLIVIA
jgi:hypothetical protein